MLSRLYPDPSDRKSKVISVIKMNLHAVLWLLVRITVAIVNLYKGKGDALNRGNYRGLKLIEQVMKVLERVVEELIRQRVEIDEMQCGFMSGRGTTDAIFIVRQLQEKHLAANKPLYMAFVDLEKAFDRVPRDVIWWAMRKLGIDEWLVRLVQSMYKDVRSRVRVGDGYSEEFGVGVGVHQGSVLSPLLFIIVLEALSREFRTGCPWELLYADDLMISAGSMEELLVKLRLHYNELAQRTATVWRYLTLGDKRWLYVEEIRQM